MFKGNKNIYQCETEIFSWEGIQLKNIYQCETEFFSWEGIQLKAENWRGIWGKKFPSIAILGVPSITNKGMQIVCIFLHKPKSANKLVKAWVISHSAMLFVKA